MTKLRGILFAIIALTLVGVPLLVGTAGPGAEPDPVYAAILAVDPPGTTVQQSNSPNGCDFPNDPITDRCGYQPGAGTPYIHVDDEGNWIPVSAEQNDGGPFDDNDNDNNDNDDNDNDDNDND